MQTCPGSGQRKGLSSMCGLQRCHHRLHHHSLSTLEDKTEVAAFRVDAGFLAHLASAPPPP